MSLVNTVLGPVDGSELGIDPHARARLRPQPGDREDLRRSGTRTSRRRPRSTRLRELKDHGIDTIVDLTVIGLGRFIPRILAVAEQVPDDQHGRGDRRLHLQRGADVLPLPGARHHPRRPRTDDRAVRPGDHRGHRRHRGAGRHPQVRDRHARDRPRASSGCCERWPRPTARPGSRSPPTRRPRPQPWGLEQQRILADEGVDLTQVVIGHSGERSTPRYHEALLANGSYLGFDHFGIGTFSLAERIESVRVLCERGHADRIVLSHDAMCHVDWFPPSMAHAWKDWRWTHIPDDVLPAMRRCGHQRRRHHDDDGRQPAAHPRRV